MQRLRSPRAFVVWPSGRVRSNGPITWNECLKMSDLRGCGTVSAVSRPLRVGVRQLVRPAIRLSIRWPGMNLDQPARAAFAGLWGFDQKAPATTLPAMPCQARFRPATRRQGVRRLVTLGDAAKQRSRFGVVLASGAALKIERRACAVPTLAKIFHSQIQLSVRGDHARKT
jgi:hypothetical protein